MSRVVMLRSNHTDASQRKQKFSYTLDIIYGIETRKFSCKKNAVKSRTWMFSQGSFQSLVIGSLDCCLHGDMKRRKIKKMCDKEIAKGNVHVVWGTMLDTKWASKMTLATLPSSRSLHARAAACPKRWALRFDGRWRRLFSPVLLAWDSHASARDS